MTLRTGVIYLLKDKLQIFSPDTGKVLEMKFTPAMIRDLDLISLESIEVAVKNLIIAGKIPPSALIIVLADNAYFTKDFVPAAPPKATAPAIAHEVQQELLNHQAEQFIEHVPFDNVVSKTMPLKNGIKVCATNKDFFEAIAVSFEHGGFTLAGVLPALVVSQGFGAQPVLTSAMANTVITKFNALKQFSLLNQQVYEPEIKHEAGEVDEVVLIKDEPKKTSKKQIYLVVGIFVVVIALLLVVVMQFMTPPPKWKATTPPPAPAAQSAAPAVATPTASASATASASGSLITTMNVQIKTTADTATTAEALREKLSTYNFKKVTTISETSTNSSSTIISFDPSVGQSVRDTVLTAVREIRTNISVKDEKNSVNDVTIIVGK